MYLRIRLSKIMQIVLKREKRAEIRKQFECTDTVVSYALNFKRHSVLCRKIRSAAMNSYSGILV